jgi:uncharacterized membrane protein
MFEHYRQPLLPQPKFFARVLRSIIFAAILLTSTILIGASVYHYVEKFPWIDAVLNAVLIMTGLGIIGILNNPAVKMFTILYALFSTIVFFAVIGILFAPLIHRFFHRFHLER